MKHFRIPTLPAVLLFYCCAFLANHVRAGQHTWTGAGGNTLWSNPANWEGNYRPQPGETSVELLFGSDSLTSVSTVDISGVAVKKLRIFDPIPVATEWRYNSSNGAKLHLNGAQVEIGKNVTFETSLEIVLSGENPVVIGSFWAFEPEYEVIFAGKISGSGGMNITPGDGVPRLRFSGNVPNTFTGRMQMTGPMTIELAKLTGPAISGPLDLWTPLNPRGLWPFKDRSLAPSVTYFNDHQIGDTSPIRTEGPIYTMGHDDVIGALTLSVGAAVSSGSGSLRVAGPVSCVYQIIPEPWVDSYTNIPSKLIGRFHLGTTNLTSGTRGFHVAHQLGLTVEAVLSSSGAGIRKTGPDMLHLAAANTFSGPVIVEEGTLRLSHAAALGTTAAGTTVNAGGALMIDAAGHAITGESLSLNGGALRVVEQDFVVGPRTATWNGLISINGGLCEFTAEPEVSTLFLPGAINGSGSFVKRGTGVVEMTGPAANSFTGPANIEAGTLKLNRQALCLPVNVNITGGEVLCLKSGVIGATRAVMVNAPGQLNTGSLDQTIGSLAGSGTVLINAGTLTAGGNNASTTFSGTLAGTSGHFIKTGSGMLSFTGVSLLGDSSTVQNGTLDVGGAFHGVLAVTAPGALCGSGTVSWVIGNGVVSPGSLHGPGTLRGGPLLMLSAGRFRVHLNGSEPGSGYDRFLTDFDVSLNGCTLETSLTFPSAAGAQFVILRKDTAGPVTGTFSGLPEGATLHIGGAQFRISYTGGDGNDVELLQLTAPPQPEISGFSIVPPGQSGAGTTVLSGTAAPSAHYIVEACTDLFSWDPVGSFDAGADGAFQFIDTDAVNHARRFYRILQPALD